MKVTLATVWSRWMPRIAPWAVLVVGMAATTTLVVSTREQFIARDKARFEHEVDHVVATVDTHLRRYAQALMAMRYWYSANQTNMTEKVWTNFIYTFHAPLHYPGIYDLGFVEKVRDTVPTNRFPELDAHIERHRKRFGPDYQLQLPSGAQAGSSWYHMPVIWHSYAQWRRDPIREYRHYGMDLNQNPDLWAAMNWALGQDMVGCSAKMEIDPDDPSITGLVLFLPIYHRGLDRDWNVVQLAEWERKLYVTPEQREAVKTVRHYLAQLNGLIFAGIDIQRFIKAHIQTNAPTVNFALYLSTDQAPRALPNQVLFDNRVKRSVNAIGTDTTEPSNPKATADALSSDAAKTPLTHDLLLYGRNFRFVFEPGPAFISAVNWRTLGVMSGFGTATTLLLSGFIAYQTRANRKEREISTALRQSESRLQTLLQDRERISRDLHDGTIQSLYAIGLGLGRLRRTLGKPEEQQRLEASLVELDHVVAELRGYLVALDPGVSPAQSAATALEELVARLQQTAATELRFTAEPGLGEGWPPEAVLDLLQAARESVSNALRHGQATQVELSLKQVGEAEVHFTIADNGKGFDLTATRRNGSHGLANLERRARAWNGSLQAESRPGGPTRITLILSLARLNKSSSAGAAPLLQASVANTPPTPGVKEGDHG